MNKTMLCIEILHLLSTKNIMSKNELADILEINPRNIIEYIKTLEDCGYEIESVRGIYGGYRLKKDSVLPVPKLSSKEIEVIKSSCSFLEHQSDFLEYKEYIKAISKILSISMETYNAAIKIVDRYPLAMDKAELLKRYTILIEAMTCFKKCEIKYLSTQNKEHVHIIHPYQVFIFNGAWITLAWNETVHDFGYFKLNRIMEIKLMSSKFTKLKTYNASEYIDNYGMKQNGEFYPIKLELTDLYTVISERIYGKNQKITKVDDHKTILECSMQNKQIILSFVLGFGSKAKVLEPTWLRDSIALEAKKILGEEE